MSSQTDELNSLKRIKNTSLLTTVSPEPQQQEGSVSCE